MQRGKAPSKRRLDLLQRDITDAEAKLHELRTAIQVAQSEIGLAAMSTALAENERLIALNRLATQDAKESLVALNTAIQASRTDDLTQLANRSVLWELLAHDLALARRQGKQLAIYFLDIDHFKEVNDRHGHAVGDLLLQHVAQVLRSTVRASDLVCRIGGDEFVILAFPIERSEVERVARKIEAVLQQPCILAGAIFTISISIGFSIFPQDADSAETLLQKADTAMYRAKRIKKERP
jgi:diguanylate cyclase (GGDEF)-like protein